MSRWENAPGLRTLIRMTHAMVDIWCRGYPYSQRITQTATVERNVAGRLRGKHS